MATKPAITQVPAHSSNYTSGRQGNTIKYVIFHHWAFEGSTLKNVFGNPARNASSTYGITTQGTTEQYVSESDTPWTSSNQSYDRQAITIETAGDWRFGYKNDKALDELIKLVAWIRSRYPGVQPLRHRDVPGASTVCPGDLPIEYIWSKSSPSVVGTTTPASASKITYKKYAEKRTVEVTTDTKLWDFSAAKHVDMNAIKDFRKGTTLDVYGYAKHPTGSVYLMTEWSFGDALKGNPNKTYGINRVDTEVVTSATVVNEPSIEETQSDATLNDSPITNPVDDAIKEFEGRLEIVEENQGLIKALLSTIGSAITTLLSKWR